MKLMAIDTSTEACSAALYVDGEVQVRFQLAPREHSRLLLPMMEGLLQDADLSVRRLDALAFGRGPGSFTGVRIAAGMIQGVALGADLPVVPVSSLTALAQGTLRETGAERVLAAIDARMHEVYWGACEAGATGMMETANEECVALPQEVPLPAGDGWTGAGSGWDTYHQVLEARLGGRLRGWSAGRFPSAEDVAVLGVRGLERGEAVAAELALPRYLRNQVASPAAPRRD
ncbi:MAG: tRNA (adenosine(37)-N6)-threonylcarbamoyltransferase complex dimerization subunit type 1 TsaB [Gammaproteobacteria bacterium]